MNIDEEIFSIDADPSLIEWIQAKLTTFGVPHIKTRWAEQMQKTASKFLLHDDYQFLFFSFDEAQPDNVGNFNTGSNNTTPTTTITPGSHQQPSKQQHHTKVLPPKRSPLHDLDLDQYTINVALNPDFATTPVVTIYFMKEMGTEVTPDNLDQVLSCGLIRGNPLHSLLDIVKSQFAPKLLASTKKWPESIQKDFSSSMHKFLASLTETSYRIRGSTVLYVPIEDIKSLKDARQDKDLVQRLEAALIFWTSQIKEVIQQKDSNEHGENSRPLDEIEYWRSRTKDLMYLKQQLDTPDVKLICDILEGSAHMSNFKQLADEIQVGCDSAMNNLLYLSTLQEPCKVLATAQPSQIPHIIPEILQMVSMIWRMSKSYHTSDRITSLLRKVSNEIIHRCCQTISLDDIFNGSVHSSMKSLEESIKAGESWKSICIETFQKLSAHYEEQQFSRKFEYDSNSVFAEIDAFVQRCNDLNEVCEAQIQFGAKGADETANGLPAFAGTKGPEITKSLLDIRHQFEKLVQELRNVNYPILDLSKSTRWHDDHGKFKNGIRDLELIMVNVLSSAFGTVRSIEQGVQLLEAFSYLAKRDTIRRTVQVKASQLYEMFMNQLDEIQTQFENQKKNRPIQPYHPQYAGAALWTQTIRDRIARDKHLLDRAYFLPRTEKEQNDMDDKFYQVYEAGLHKFQDELYTKWEKSIQPLLEEFDQMTNIPIMRRVEGNLVNLNFSPELQCIFMESRYWSRIPGYEPPTKLIEAMGGLEDEEKLRTNMENVNLVVRDYNQIILSMTEQQKHLFRERIRKLDKKINPAFSNLYWSSKGVIDYFVTECRKFCHEKKMEIKEFNERVAQIEEQCVRIQDTLLIKIDPKTVYHESSFDKEQSQHRTMVKRQLINANEKIVEMMKALYDIFKTDIKFPEIEREWWLFVQGIEKKVENALRTTLKRSLQKLSTVINEDKENQETQNPLFLVSVILDDDEEGNKRPSLKPSVSDLRDLVEKNQSELSRCTSVVTRLEPTLRQIIEEEQRIEREAQQDQELEEEPDEDERIHKRTEYSERRAMEAKARKKVKLPNYTDSIRKQKLFVELIVSTVQGMLSVNQDIDNYLDKWTEEYSDIWNTIRENFLRRLALPKKRPASSFETEIEKYKVFHNSIQQEEQTHVIGYLQLDCAPLKHTLVMECISLQNALLDLLHKNAKTELEKIYKEFEDNSRALSERPRDRETLSKKLELLSHMRKLVEKDPNLQEDEQKSEMEKKYDPIISYYQLLGHYDKNLSDEEVENLKNLEAEGSNFVHVVKKSEKELMAHREEFKLKLQQELLEFEKKVDGLKKDVENRGPYRPDESVQQAKSQIADYRNKLQSCIKDQRKLKEGVKLFDMQMKNYKQLKEVEKTLQLMEKIWTLQERWNITWDSWKFGTFNEIDVNAMEQEAAKFISDVNRMAKDIRDWPIWQSLSEELDQFKRTLPLILDLKNEAMRGRHWDDLRDIISEPFDEKGKEFNLEKIFNLGFDSYAEDISQLSHSASQELSIERDLEKIKQTWYNTNLNVVPYRDDYLKLSATDDIFQNLDDNQVSLGSMKISPYVAAFQSEVTYWEKSLSSISETIELILIVQTSWQYLLNIFEVEDIQKQLPEETGIFKMVNNKWKILMEGVNEAKNVLKATQKDGLMDTLNEMNGKLEQIQKQLDDYLEKKRQEFPRFYFLSDGDLLEILGQARDPNAVQKHLENCFEGIHKLKIEKQENKSGTHFIAKGMLSKKGEYVPFVHPVTLEGPVEKWLKYVEDAMRAAVKRLLARCFQYSGVIDRDKWINEYQGQLLITASQLLWTKKITEALTKQQPKKALRALRKKWNTYLKQYSAKVRTKLPSLTRSKLIALLTIEVHSRDALDALYKSGCSNIDDFEWLKQLRFYWDEEKDSCVVRQTSAEVDYDNEYLGNSSRLVITPLTERCYMTLTTAVQLHKGGNPKGPAGTGKTETVKDLSKAIGKRCLVLNCSDGLDYQSMGRMFSGLCQTGAWSCFDEFNRIELPVLSVVSTQIRTIQAALRSHMTRFRFEDSDIRLDSKTGIFITMNPGYAGRVELPDNLKALFRPCTMVVPDLAIICEIMLFSEGFIEARVLARKMIKLYDLAKGQLSKQNHYDWGLRALKSILVVAGRLKRENPDKDEATLLMKALYDMNVAKFVFEDTPLFEDLLNDLFVSINIDRSSNPSLFKAIKADLKKHDYMLFDDDQQVNKVIQLYETMGTRHSVMVVGGTSGGKSVVINTLKRAQDKLGLPTKLYTLNPKAQTVNELYGVMDNDTREWIDGLLSNIFRRINVQSEKGEERRYVLFDGDVDAVWIENMNSVMDDNKVLTLPNGERIDLVTPQCSLLFEVGDLQYASPATVSRCGMVYVDPKNLPCESYFYRWKVRTFRDDEDKGAIFDKFFEHYVNRALDFVLEGVEPDGTISRPVNLILPVTRINMVTQLCTIVESLLPSLEKIREEKELECVFLFCLMWSVGGSVVDAERARFDKFVKTITNCKVVDNSGNSEAFIPAGSYPKAFTLYEYFYDSEHHQWKHWESVVPEYHAPEDGKFSSILVPTIDTERYSFLLKTVLSVDKPVLFVGEPGTAKTVIIQSYLNQVANDDPSKFANLNINFSSRTTSMDVQRTIEDNIEKRIGDTFGPLGGKRLRVFIDDLSMPKVDTYGTQQPIALLKLLVENGGLYERGSGDKLDWKKIVSLDYIAATAPPGGSNNQVDPRFISLFSCFNLTFPSPESLHSIYSSILMTHLSNFNEIVRGVGEKLTNMTLDLYNYIVQKLPPTPSKFHYVFNLRDLSRVYSGLCLSNTENFIESAQFLRLWRNETTRVFHDRLISPDDKKLVTDYIAGLIEKNCPEQKDAALANPMLFGDFLDVNEKMPVRLYQDLVDYSTVKKVVEEQLLLYNDTMERPMNLVMFDAAIEHLCRVHRIIRMDRGHALLVGVGGSGKQSLTRLAAFLAGFEVFTINICRGYGDTHFRDDLKMLYDKLGVENKKVVFLFTDAHVLDEGFLEYINNMLTTGMVPALFPDEEKDQKISAVSREVREAGMVENKENCWNYFISKCRDNLHIVLAMSPAGNALRVRCRNFPGLVSSTSIDWFLPWPSQALEAVADRFLQQVDIPEENREDIVQHMIKVHLSVGEYSRRFEQELRRYNYVTPKNYLDYIAMYKQMLDRNRKELDTKSDKLQKGLNMLKKAKDEVESMKQTLSETKIVVQNKTVQVNQLLVDISKSTAEAMSNRKTAQKKDEELSVQTAEIEKQKEAAEIELAEAEPILQAAEDALRDLNRDDITQMKSFANPHDFVKDVGKCIVILLGKGGMEPSWKNAKALMGDVSFIKKLINYDKNLLSQARVNQIKAIVKKNGSSFNPSDLKSKSSAAAGLLTWVDAIVKFFKVWKSVEPKRRMVEKAQKKLDKSMKDLAEIKATLSELEKNIQNLNEELAKRESEANELKEKADSMEKKLNKANKLIEGLGSERTRWAIEIEDLKQKRIRLVGDCLLGSGFMCYTGAFTVAFRNQLMKDIWFTDLQERNIPVTENFHLNNILTSEVQIAQWESEGLPSDEVSVQNGILTDRAHKFPLCIDPQLQAISWIKERERKNDLVIRTFNDADFMRELENAIKFGRPFLFENVDEFIDPMIEPVLDMNLLEGKGVIKLSGEEVEVDKGFRLYLCTRLSNPHYSPEIYGKTQIINYSVTFDGLQEQLLNGVVNHERPELEEERKRLVQETNSNKIELAKLEEKILHELSISGNTSLIENDDLIQTLDNTKSRVADIQVKLVKAQETSKEIEKAREAYRVVAKRGAILFFAMASLSGINSMYEYSLSSYSSDVYEFSLTKSEHSKMFDGRLQNIIDYLTFRAYTYTCNGLFEEHKLTFSMLITTKILEREGQMNMQQYDFFLKGNVSLDKLSQENPFDWISDQGWKDLLKLPTLEMLEGPNPFENIASDVIEHEKVWKAWYDVDDCENKPLPLNYDEKLSQFQKICLIKCFRVDRIMRAVTKFISAHMGERFVKPPVLDYQDIFNGSTNVSPIVCMISPGYDPASDIIKLAEKLNKRYKSISLGQGQGKKALDMLDKGMSKGHWVVLQNCHLLVKWMKNVEKILNSMEKDKVHKEFRLWLTTEVSPEFPLAILQRALKVVTEPPNSLQLNMATSFSKISEEQFNACPHPAFKPLVFVLAYFHAVIQERRKYGKIGWNVPYDFNRSDFDVSFSLLDTYLTKAYEYGDPVPWDSLKYLVGEAMYGGRVTDDFDRRILITYLNEYMGDFLFDTFQPFYFFEDEHRSYSLPQDCITKSLSLEDYKSHVEETILVDNTPEVFGLHPNAEIGYLTNSARSLFQNLLELQPRGGAATGSTSREDYIGQIARGIQEKIPQPFDRIALVKKIGKPSPIDVVLLQEVERWNILVTVMQQTLSDLQRALVGEIGMSAELENLSFSLFNGMVPSIWRKYAPKTRKTLSNWLLHFQQRYQQYDEWIETSSDPMVIWLSGLHVPESYLTALVQVTCKKYKWPLDRTTSIAKVTKFTNPNQIKQKPKDGCYVKGLFLEGADWDLKTCELKRQEPKKLVVELPIVLISPIENSKVKLQNTHTTPVYVTADRGSASGVGLVFTANLDTTDHTSHWILQSAAITLETDD
uniref:Dynein-1, subspecies f n=1 Tax=Percolomonas cosmopolitus TaxID=63605 RepID=A0A7S1KLH4_9EUKA|mmetsp:Transcript_10515/g.39096  ORF Transcript_10515/g.39096 Transcript_10515/m.39096 type:complete len:4619 (+) Transcript_10515:182-14038(+)